MESDLPYLPASPPPPSSPPQRRGTMPRSPTTPRTRKSRTPNIHVQLPPYSPSPSAQPFPSPAPSSSSTSTVRPSSSAPLTTAFSPSSTTYPTSPSLQQGHAVAYTPPRPGQRPLHLPQKVLTKPTKVFVPPIPWSPSSSRPPSTNSFYVPSSAGPYPSSYASGSASVYDLRSLPRERDRDSYDYYSVPPLSAYADYPFSPSSSRSSSPPSTPDSGRSSPSSSHFSKRTSSPQIPYSPSYLAFPQHTSPIRSRSRPTGEYITPPSQPLLRPTTFWKNAYRTALGLPSDAPSSQLVRSAAFIVAGKELPAPELVEESWGYLWYQPRARVREAQEEKVVLVPEAVGAPRAFY